jgi:hypothetical protein
MSQFYPVVVDSPQEASVPKFCNPCFPYCSWLSELSRPWFDSPAILDELFVSRSSRCVMHCVRRFHVSVKHVYWTKIWIAELIRISSLTLTNTPIFYNVTDTHDFKVVCDRRPFADFLHWWLWNILVRSGTGWNNALELRNTGVSYPTNNKHPGRWISSTITDYVITVMTESARYAH